MRFYWGSGVTYFLEIILLLVIVPVGVYFLVRKQSPKDAHLEAEKVLGSAISAQEYCLAHNISEEALLSMIGRSEIKAYESMGMLFVQSEKVDSDSAV